MKALYLIRSRKYLQRIIASFMLVVLLLIVTAAVLYFNAQNNILDIQQDHDRRLLTQMNYNIENMNSIVKDLAVSLFNDDDLIALKSGSDFKQSILRIDKLNRIVTDSPYLHSVVFYNANQQRYFSSLNHDLNNIELYDALGTYIRTYSPVPKLQLIPLKLNARNPDSFDTFSFFIYNGATPTKEVEFLVLNVKPGWMLDNVEALHEVSERTNNVVFITDHEGKVLISNHPLEAARDELKDELLGRIAASERAIDHFIYAYNGIKYQVSYLTRGLNDWQIISLQDYDVVQGSVIRMRWTAIIVTLSVALLAVLLSVYNSARLYKPVGKLLSQMRLPAAGLQARDELSAIAFSYNQISDKLTKLESDQANQSNIAMAYRLRSLLTDSKEVPAEEFRQMIDKYDLDLAAEGNYLVALVGIDATYALPTASNESILSLYSFAISNIGAELLRQTCRCEVIEPRRGQIIFLISREDALAVSDLHESFRNLQAIVERYYPISCTVALSPVFPNYDAITERYAMAQRYFNYRIALGRRSLIDQEAVRINEQNEQMHIPKEWERQLAECIRSADRTGVESALRKWTDLVSTFAFDPIHSSLLHLVVTLNNLIAEINGGKVDAADINLREMNRRAMELDTLEEIREMLTAFLLVLFDKRQSGRDDKKRLLVETVKEIVDKHFADPDLNVQRIADMLRMSHIYIGQVFKEMEGASIVDYLNDTRLVKARSYLEQFNLTVSELTAKAGFGSESYFYRLFKRKYGVTPKEYRLQHAKQMNV